MAPKVALFTDTASDILQFDELYKSMDITVIYQYINIGKETFTDETLTLDQLLEKMNVATKETWPKTSQPPAGDFVPIYQKMKDEGFTDVISVHVSSKLSGTINSSRLGADEVEGLNVYLVDSQMASLGIIPSILKAKQLIDNGTEPAEIQRIVNEYASNQELFAAVPTLENLYMGGRLKPIRFLLGRFLKFKPIITIVNGELTSVDKTKKLGSTQEQAYLRAITPYSKDDDFQMLISHAWAEETGKAYVERFQKEFPGKEVRLGRIGPLMAVHLGPGGIVFMAFKV